MATPDCLRDYANPGIRNQFYAEGFVDLMGRCLSLDRDLENARKTGRLAPRAAMTECLRITGWLSGSSLAPSDTPE